MGGRVSGGGQVRIAGSGVRAMVVVRHCSELGLSIDTGISNQLDGWCPCEGGRGRARLRVARRCRQTDRQAGAECVSGERE